MSRLVKRYLSRRQVWVIPMIYVVATLAAGFTLPRLEYTYLSSYDIKLSVSSAQAMLSSISSGMMALTGIVFSLAFVMVQFSATAYSPRLVIWLSNDPVLFHALGVFIATFCYAIATLAWTIYNDQRKQTPGPPPADSIARQVRITLRDQDTVLPPGTDRITEVVATQITRQASPPE